MPEWVSDRRLSVRSDRLRRAGTRRHRALTNRLRRAAAPSGAAPRRPRPARRRRPPATKRARRARRRASPRRRAASQACPTNITMLVGEQHERLDLQTRSGSTDHSSRSSRDSVSTGFSSSSTDAARAERPAARPGCQPGGAAAGQPAPVAVADHAERRDRAAGVALDEAQRPARGLKVEHEPAARADLVADEPRGEAVVARRAARSASAATAASAAVASGGVGRERLAVQRAVHLILGPGTASEDAGRVAHR